MHHLPLHCNANDLSWNSIIFTAPRLLVWIDFVLKMLWTDQRMYKAVLGWRLSMDYVCAEKLLLQIIFMKSCTNIHPFILLFQRSSVLTRVSESWNLIYHFRRAVAGWRSVTWTNFSFAEMAKPPCCPIQFRFDFPLYKYWTETVRNKLNCSREIRLTNFEKYCMV